MAYLNNTTEDINQYKHEIYASIMKFLSENLIEKENIKSLSIGRGEFGYGLELTLTTRGEAKLDFHFNKLEAENEKLKNELSTIKQQLKDLSK